VAGLRDEHDPALDNAQTGELAWHHTSASRDWPAPDYSEQQKARLLAVADRFHYDVREVIARQAQQAPHVGTYEAAIENMLRRIRVHPGRRQCPHEHHVGRPRKQGCRCRAPPAEPPPPR
jgi:hypothetical protein